MLIQLYLPHPIYGIKLTLSNTVCLHKFVGNYVIFEKEHLFRNAACFWWRSKRPYRNIALDTWFSMFGMFPCRYIDIHKQVTLNGNWKPCVRNFLLCFGLILQTRTCLISHHGYLHGWSSPHCIVLTPCIDLASCRTLFLVKL